MTTATPPRGDAPWPAGHGADPDDRPASAGEVRTLRRWLAVVGVWAAAATAVGLIALLEEDRTAGAGGSVEQIARDVEDLERDLEERIAELEDAGEDAPSAGDLDELGARLDELEADVGQAAESASEAGDAAEALSARVDALEARLGALEGDAEAPTEQ